MNSQGYFLCRKAHTKLINVKRQVSGYEYGTFDYGCTTVEVDRSQVSLGAATGPFIDAIISNHLLAKTFYVNPTNDNATGKIEERKSKKKNKKRREKKERI